MSFPSDSPPPRRSPRTSWPARLSALLGGRLSRPPVRLDPRWRGLIVVALVALVAALVAGWQSWRARPRLESAPQASVAASRTTPAPTGLSGPAGSAGLAGSVGADPATGTDPPRAAPAASSVVVAVAGRVRRPGLVRLAAGSRVADAVAAAGGPLPGVDLGLLNLARRVADGEQVVVGLPQPAPAGLADPGGALAGASGTAAGGPVNLNTATAEQLDTLPGVGPVLAQRIVDFRQQHGGFRAIDDLRGVQGIGDAKFADLKPLVTV